MPPCSSTLAQESTTLATEENQLSSDLHRQYLLEGVLSLPVWLQELNICLNNCIEIIKNIKVDQIKLAPTQLALSQCTSLCHLKESLRSVLQQEPKNHNCLHEPSSVGSSLPEIRSLQHGMALRGSDNNHNEAQNDSGYGSGRAPVHRYYHRSPFNSENDLEKLERNDYELSQCCFYFGSIDSQTSKDLLRKTPTGTFLIRDSSHSGYLYTLSVKTERGATSVRILYSKGLFQFDSDERIRNKLPQFDSVLGLVDFHVMVTHDGGNKSWQWEEMSGHRSMKATLTKPLRSSVPSLAHLSRVKINQCLDNSYLSQVVDTLPVVSDSVKEFIKEYPYRI